jgi:hypothetical protein
MLVKQTPEEIAAIARAQKAAVLLFYANLYDKVPNSSFLIAREPKVLAAEAMRFLAASLRGEKPCLLSM